MNQDRITAVKALVEYADSLAVIRDGLYKFSWDDQEDIVEIAAGHIINVLKRYLERALSASNVEEWADLIECREDISFAEDSENWIAETIYELANPSLTGSLTPERAQEIIEMSGLL